MILFHQLQMIVMAPTIAMSPKINNFAVSALKVLHSQAPKSPIEDILHVTKEDFQKDVSALLILMLNNNS